MKKLLVPRFALGDHVTWNSEVGRVIGRIVAIHDQDFPVHGYTHHASPEDPQYAIQNDKSCHVAYHKGGILRSAEEGSRD
ncbi:DUF2945 domain-containing protein [Acidithiobacillus thiooxidans]|uniref:DUF2945 domain-containing protein n=1 Tax=Acidithiobacillus thiooxidans TaxID=930 RepID=UPI00356AB822|nr:DUF2945 domain-containing protein [Acidithiobacillus sp.]